MKRISITIGLMAAGLFVGGIAFGTHHDDAESRAAARPVMPAAWHADPQFAAGEWKIEIQTPPCENLQVIWPKESGAPLTVECDLMPVNTR
jgi:hypothetical protein